MLSSRKTYRTVGFSGLKSGDAVLATSWKREVLKECYRDMVCRTKPAGLKGGTGPVPEVILLLLR